MSDNIYNFRKAEQKWKSLFNSFSTSNESILKNNKKYYVLEMLPYPSGKIHMGHVRNYVIGDVVARQKVMQGFDVIHPMGWDAFGMPAENAALSSGVNPAKWTYQNIKDMKAQIEKLSCIYDWNREIATCSPKYYAKEQEIFLDMLKNGLVYRKKSYVNWDPVDNTVLANEQVINGRGWRSGAIVEKRMLEQWSVNITKYCEELLDGLKDLEGLWPEKVLKMQENWIGKSKGAVIRFDLEEACGEHSEIEVFSTRPDTLFGASFVAVSPDHEVAKILAKSNVEVSEFIEECKQTPNTEEYLEKAEKKGINTGLTVVHPFDDSIRLPVYIANFVLIDYGKGAVFGCPAHDERDYEFAKKYDLPIKKVIDNNNDDGIPFLGDGKVVSSEFLNGLSSGEAKSVAIAKLVEIGKGEEQITYRLRDWLVSRQRYWGCPIPVIHCGACGVVPLAKEDLPLELPDDVKFDGKGNPLENHPTWKHVKCPRCGGDALRDTDTLDTFFESSWYFFRYLDRDCESPINKEIAEKAIPVDLYIGGIEHAVLHLLYARFFTLALRDMGYFNVTHPFGRLLTQGMVCHKSYQNSDGNYIYPDEVFKDDSGKLIDKNGNEVTEGPSEKMSKSKKNTISPDDIISSHGVDAVRLFIVSDTPPEKDFEWNTDALDGSWRFLNKVWKVFNQAMALINSCQKGNDELTKGTHIYLKKINESLDAIALNKTVALARELFNNIESKMKNTSAESLRFSLETFIRVISIITPNIAHEMFEQLSKTPLIQSAWPEVDESLAVVNTVTIAVQINGKLRATFEIEKDSDDSAVKERALKEVEANVTTDEIKKIIVVKNKIVSIVK